MVPLLDFVWIFADSLCSCGLPFEELDGFTHLRSGRVSNRPRPLPEHAQICAWCRRHLRCSHRMSVTCGEISTPEQTVDLLKKGNPMVINNAKLRRATVSAALCSASLLSNAVHAADVHVLATGALSAAFRELGPWYERPTGNHLVISWGLHTVRPLTRCPCALRMAKQ